MHWKKFLLGLALASAILFLLLRRVDPQAVWLALRAADWPWLAVVTALGCGSIFLKGERWAVAIAGRTGERPRRRLFAASMIGTAANMLLPARLGDVLRALVLRKHNAIPTTRALLASWSSQAFDVLAVVILMLAGAASHPGLASRRVLLLVFAAVVAGGIIAALFARRPEGLLRWIARIPGALGAKASGLARHALDGLRFLGEPAVLLTVVLFTIAIWTLDVTGIWLALRAFHIDVGLPGAALLVAAIGLSFALPLTPGNVGTYQLIAVFVLGRFGVERDPAFAFGLGFQAYALVTTVGLGAAFFQREGLSLATLSAAPLPPQSPPQAP